MLQVQKRTGGNESTLVLKPMGRVIRSPKQRVLEGPQNALRYNKIFTFAGKQWGNKLVELKAVVLITNLRTTPEVYNPIAFLLM